MFPEVTQYCGWRNLTVNPLKDVKMCQICGLSLIETKSPFLMCGFSVVYIPPFANVVMNSGCEGRVVRNQVLSMTMTFSMINK